MRLLLTVGYDKILFGKGANISSLLEAFDGAKTVKDDQPYRQPRKITIEEGAKLNVELVSDDSVCLPENHDNELYESFHKLASERDDLRKKVKELEDKISKVNADIK